MGRENVYFVVFEENRFILDVLGLVPQENVITIKRDSFMDLATGTLAALRKIQDLQIDTAIDMEFFSRSSAALTFLTGAKRRIGFHTFFGDGPYRGDLMTHRLLYNPYHHTSQIFRLMVEATLEDPARLPTRSSVPAPVDREPPAFVMRPGEADTVRECCAKTMAALIRDRSSCSTRMPAICCPCANGPPFATSNWPNAFWSVSGLPHCPDWSAQRSSSGCRSRPPDRLAALLLDGRKNDAPPAHGALFLERTAYHQRQRTSPLCRADPRGSHHPVRAGDSKPFRRAHRAQHARSGWGWPAARVSTPTTTASPPAATTSACKGLPSSASFRPPVEVLERRKKATHVP